MSLLELTFYGTNGGTNGATQLRSSQGTYDVGEYNRLTTDADGNTYSYDAKGNIIRKVAVGGAVTVFSWDHRNRLIAVDEFANTTDADADNQRHVAGDETGSDETGTPTLKACRGVVATHHAKITLCDDAMAVF